MRIPRTPDLLATEHHSVVDSVRRTRRPPYARHALWTNWVSPGGVVWLFVCLRLFLLLWTYGVFTGFLMHSGWGIPYWLPERKLASVDLQRLLGGEPVRDGTGRVLIDPQGRDLTVLAIDENGSVELKYEKTDGSEERRRVVILIPHEDCEYQHIIDAMDDLRSASWDLGLNEPELWLARPSGSSPAP